MTANEQKRAAAVLSSITLKYQPFLVSYKKLQLIGGRQIKYFSYLAPSGFRTTLNKPPTGIKA